MSVSLSTLLDEIAAFLSPMRVGLSVNNGVGVARLLQRLGYEREASTLQDFITPISEIVTTLEKIDVACLADVEHVGPEDSLQLLKCMTQAIRAIAELGILLNGIGLPANLSKEILSLLFVNYLYGHWPALYRLGVLIGAIDVDVVPDHGDANSRDREYARVLLNLDKFSTLLVAPGSLLEAEYGWGTRNFDYVSFLRRLAKFGEGLGLGLFVDRIDDKIVNKFLPSLSGSSNRPWQIEIPIFQYDDGQNDGEIVLAVIPVDGLSVDDRGIGIIPFARGKISSDFEVLEGLQVVVEGSANLQGGILVAINPHSGIQIHPGVLDGMNVDGNIRIGLRYSFSNEASLISIPGAIIRLNQAGIAMIISDDNTESFFGMEVSISGAEIIIGGLEADGFLNKILPSTPLKIEFDLSLGMDTLQGFYVLGSGGFGIEIPLHLRLGPARIPSVAVGFEIIGCNQEPHLATNLHASLAIALGPISVAIDRLGARVAATLPPDTLGNLGPVDLQLGFLPPTCAGISVNTGAVCGGGFLDFNKDNKRYTGILALKIGEIGITAIGLITTKMPDGSKGFAMLASMGVDFNPPIQLSMGFTLNKVGGLIGINRTMMVDVLREGIKKHTLDAILCPDPEWVIPNASKIISDLRTVFPPAEGHYVIGPMVQIGYGSPTIITADIGIFLELEGTQLKRALLLGKLKMLLPKPEEAIVKINLDIIGVLDLEKKELSFQASLYDSSILMYEIFGDAAFFLSWGAKPEFAMSLGGFHPRFAPPQPSIIFADLKRLGMNLSKGSNFQLSCGAYQAVTPNSLQFGARAELYASAGKAEISGYLSFDTLIYFSPFRFEVDIGAGVTIRYRKASLADVRISMTLCGPSAWSARGTAHVKILFFEIDVDFNITWGRDAPPALDPVNPWPHFEQALLRAESWGGLLPSSTHMVASLRKIEPDKTSAASSEEPSAAPVVVHPAGSLELRQNVVPLKTTLGKFGNAPVIGYDRFEITRLTTKDNIRIEIEDVDEFFARGQFENLSNSQKLSVPAFEKIPGGIKTKSLNRISVQGEIQSTPVRHEPIVINADRTSQRALEEGISRWDQMRILSAGSASRRSALRFGRQARFAPTGSPLVATVQERYVIVKRETLQQVDIWEGEGARVHADQALLNHLKRHPEQSGSLMVIAASEVVEAAYR